MAGFAVICVLTLTLWQVMSSRAQALRQGDGFAVALARVAEEHCLSTLVIVDHVLREVLNRVSPDGRLPSGELDKLLTPHLRQFPILRNVFVLGPDGTVRQASVKGMVGADLRGQDYFSTLAADPSQGIAVSVPEHGRASAASGITVARPILDQNGVFSGVVAGTVESRVFEDQLGSLVASGRSFAVFMRLDGLVLGRVPDGDVWRGTRNAAGPAVLAAAKDPSGVLHAVGTMDGTPGILAYRRLNGFPLLVVAGLRQNSILAEWREEALIQGAVGLGLSIIIVLLGYRLDRGLRERRRIRQELAASEERYRLLIEHSPLGIIQAEGGGITVYANQRWQDLAGLDGGAFGRPWFDAVAEPDRAAIRRAWLEMTRQGEAFEMDIRLGTRQSPERWVRVHASALGSGGERYVTTFEDITRTRDVARSLSLSEEKFAKAFRGSPDALVISTRDEGRYLEVNGAFCRLLGYSEAEFLGSDARSMRIWGDLSDRDMLMRLLAERDLVENFRTSLRRRDGNRITVLVSAQSLVVEDTPCLLCICRDITERQELESHARDLVARLDASNKELEQFAYVASHDLQEPLRMIASYAQLLERRYGGRLDADADEFIAYLVDGAKRMQVMIRDLLEYSRVGRLGQAFTSFDGSKALAEAQTNLLAAIQETGARVVAGAMPQVVADRSQFVRLLQNLLGNALKYHHPDRAPEIAVSAERMGAEWQFSVADNGIGIEAQYFDRIFMVFQRLHTREQFAGTGIGLAICQKIVQRHGGRLWVDSIPGEGSVFRFTLPVADETVSDHSAE